jgi:N,N-dimethylformamidase
MYLIEWLERRGIPYEVITDVELHREGRSAVDGYAAVVTGAHPEYYSAAMLDALEDFRDNGGGLVYLGGNGFYWVTEPYALDPLVIEIRRGYAGIRSWESLPGEVTLVANGRPGGLWRHRGRAPQRLVGIGFCAQGWGRSEPYYLAPAASEDAYKWIFDGVDDEPLGAYGAVMGGAAGDELDRADRGLGTPPHAVVLASSGGHTNFYQRVVEEVPMGAPDSTGGQQDPAIKADIVYFETPGGGRVFSTGSIAWSGALLANGGDNGVSKVTENVLRAFCTRPGG